MLRGTRNPSTILDKLIENTLNGKIKWNYLVESNEYSFGDIHNGCSINSKYFVLISTKPNSQGITFHYSSDEFDKKAYERLYTLASKSTPVEDELYIDIDELDRVLSNIG